MWRGAVSHFLPLYFSPPAGKNHDRSSSLHHWDRLFSSESSRHGFDPTLMTSWRSATTKFIAAAATAAAAFRLTHDNSSSTGMSRQTNFALPPEKEERSVSHAGVQFLPTIQVDCVTTGREKSF